MSAVTNTSTLPSAAQAVVENSFYGFLTIYGARACGIALGVSPMTGLACAAMATAIQQLAIPIFAKLGIPEKNELASETRAWGSWVAARTLLTHYVNKMPIGIAQSLALGVAVKVCHAASRTIYNQLPDSFKKYFSK